MCACVRAHVLMGVCVCVMCHCVGVQMNTCMLEICQCSRSAFFLLFLFFLFFSLNSAKCAYRHTHEYEHTSERTIIHAYMRAGACDGRTDGGRENKRERARACACLHLHQPIVGERVYVGMHGGMRWCTLKLRVYGLGLGFRV